ncbi:hypothetical protein B0H17DRAFT_1214522 [Mycena rosella]|uniref:Uncharacterized protein n=1 Tax=Mycena rosella TaxID=1033263 RepID=A0AAD7G312_MYCRO|nr:hypothetical protein B0H17DRAFT_1214522 [Mycena rosella]
MLASRYPALAHLEITFEDSFAAKPNLRTAATSSIVCALTGIRTLAVQCVDALAWQHLASLDTLTSLKIDVSDFTLPDDSSSSQLILASLEVLEIRASHMSQCTKFIAILSHPLLKRLIIRTDVAATQDESRSLFLAIYHQCAHPMLTSLDVQLSRLARDGDFTAHVAYLIRSPTLRPLLTFANLSKLHISFPSGICLDDAFVAEMALAWPQLEELSIDFPSAGGHCVSDVTIPGLLAFAHHCPALHTLHLPLGPEFPVEWDPSFRPAYTQHALIELNVLDSPIDAAFPVAAFLSFIFPSLSRIVSSHRPLHMYEQTQGYTSWREVEMLVPLFVKVRAQEECHWRRELAIPPIV